MHFVNVIDIKQAAFIKATKIFKEYKNFDPITSQISKSRKSFVEMGASIYAEYPNTQKAEFDEILKILKEKYSEKIQKDIEHNKKRHQLSEMEDIGKDLDSLRAEEILKNWYLVEDLETDGRKAFLCNKHDGSIKRYSIDRLMRLLPKEEYPEYYARFVIEAHPIYDPTGTNIRRLIKKVSPITNRVEPIYEYNTYSWPLHRIKYHRAGNSTEELEQHPHFEEHVKIFWEYLTFLAATEEDAYAMLYYMAIQVRAWEFRKVPVIIFLVAEGGIGKSTLFKLLSLLHGDENTASRDGRDSLNDNRITDYIDKTLLTMDEIMILNNADYNPFKLLTGDYIGGNQHYVGFKRIKLHLNVWCATNHFHLLRGLHKDNRRDVIIGLGGKGMKLDEWVDKKRKEEPEGDMYNLIYCNSREKLPEGVKLQDYAQSIFSFLCNLGPTHEAKLREFIIEPYKNQHHATKIYQASSPSWVFDFFNFLYKQVKSNPEKYHTAPEHKLRCPYTYMVGGTDNMKILDKIKSPSGKKIGNQRFFDQMKQFEPTIITKWIKRSNDCCDIFFDDIEHIAPENFSGITD